MASRRQLTRFIGLSLLTGAGVVLQQDTADAAVATDLATGHSGKVTVVAGAPGSHVEYLAQKYNADKPKSDKKHDDKSDDKTSKYEDDKGPEYDVPPHKDLPPPKYESTPPPVKETAPPTYEDECPTETGANLAGYTWTINGVGGFTTLDGNVKPGDTVQVDFDVAADCEDQELSLAAYSAPSENFDPATADQQKLFDSETGRFDAGTNKLTVKIPACFYQIDFVTGGVLETLGPEGSDNFYGDRLIATDTGGEECVTPAVETEVTPPVEVASTVIERPAETTAAAELAETGVETTEFAMLGGYLLLMGLALEGAARSRRRIPA